MLRVMGGVKVPIEEANRVVQVYRSRYPAIPKLWREANRAIENMASGYITELGRNGIIKVTPDGILLPNGLTIHYKGLHSEINPETGYKEWVYYQGKRPVRLYGGKLVENCLAQGTLVLTDSGWKYIEDVTLSDKVHDGVEFVTHGGVVSKSEQTCVIVDGVYMTPDHEVLTDDGWQEASQFPRPYRPDVRRSDRLTSFPHRREEMEVGVQVPVWESDNQDGGRRNKGSETRRDPQLWVHDETIDRGEEHNPRDDKAPRLLGLAKYARPMQAAFARCLGKLRSSWDYSLCKVGGVLREFLGGHGSNVPVWVGNRTQEQRWPLQSGELCVGYETRELHEPTHYTTRGGHQGVVLGVGNRVLNNPIQTQCGMAYRGPDVTPEPFKPKVYDIMNCGPRSRFVVLGNNGPFIVHNCSQAMARIIIGEQMLRIARRYKPVLTVHDAVGAVAPVEHSCEAVEYIEECMSWTPKWAEGLPLACESGAGLSYGASDP